ncbi:MAG: hypothetical protein AAFR11_14725 [Pseudomonadota bacterium]
MIAQNAAAPAARREDLAGPFTTLIDLEGETEEDALAQFFRTVVEPFADGETEAITLRMQVTDVARSLIGRETKLGRLLREQAGRQFAARPLFVFDRREAAAGVLAWLGHADAASALAAANDAGSREPPLAGAFKLTEAVNDLFWAVFNWEHYPAWLGAQSGDHGLIFYTDFQNARPIGDHPSKTTFQSRRPPANGASERTCKCAKSPTFGR